MRIRLTLANTISLPIAYHRILQRAFYALWSPADVAGWHASRGFRPFTFSRLLGRAQITQHTLLFQGPVNWWLSFVSAKDAFEVLQRLQATPTLMLDSQAAVITRMEVEPSVPWQHSVMGVTTLSPIVADDNVNGRIVSYAPEDPQFGAHIARNAAAKARQFLGDAASPVTIRALESTQVRSWYGTTPVVGYRGRFIVRGDPAVLQLLYDIGLGRRNGLGFGCFERFLVDPTQEGLP